MRVFHLPTILLLFVLPLAASGEQLVRGPETLLGNADLAPLGGASLQMASDGDEVVLAFITRNCVYAQRLDRNGVALTPLPVLIASGNVVRRAMDPLRVVYAGGFYTFFFTRYDHATQQWSVQATRVTRDLELVETRAIEASSLLDAVRTNGDIVVMTYDSLWFLRDDLSVIRRTARVDGAMLVASPQGALMLTALEPVLSARFLDNGLSARIAGVYKPQKIAGAWTGSEFLIAWSDWGHVYAATLDAELRVRVKPVLLSDFSNVCADCSVSVVAMSSGEALVRWQRGSTSLAARFRDGVMVEKTPWILGTSVTPFVTSSGLVIMAGPSLDVRAFVAGAVSEPAKQSVTATVRVAAEESLAAVAASASEVAVARHRADGTNFVSVVDHDGRALRDVRIANGARVALAHDGTAFYALVTDGYTAQFQKVADGAGVTKLNVRLANLLHWEGTQFLILQNGYADFTGAQVNKTRALAIARDGTVGLPRCAMWEFPLTSGRARVLRGGTDTFIAVENDLARLRDDCQTGPPDPLVKTINYQFAAAWNGSVWARLAFGGPVSRLQLSFAPDLTSAAEGHDVAAELLYGEEETFDVAPAGDRWLVIWNKNARLESALFDANGRVAGTATIADDALNGVRLVPVSNNRVLAIYQRQVYDPPYLGVTRVFAARMTLDPASRRRTVRP
ncbi:MAG TPA: hypothetical protein VM733_00545 [Thermoanaerobaculia bacterium]|nr:hypothetical protein [Thermoanaerobaculia bacterium]